MSGFLSPLVSPSPVSSRTAASQDYRQTAGNISDGDTDVRVPQPRKSPVLLLSPLQYHSDKDPEKPPTGTSISNSLQTSPEKPILDESTPPTFTELPKTPSSNSAVSLGSSHPSEMQTQNSIPPENITADYPEISRVPEAKSGTSEDSRGVPEPTSPKRPEVLPLVTSSQFQVVSHNLSDQLIPPIEAEEVCLNVFGKTTQWRIDLSFFFTRMDYHFPVIWYLISTCVIIDRQVNDTLIHSGWIPM